MPHRGSLTTWTVRCHTEGLLQHGLLGATPRASPSYHRKVESILVIKVGYETGTVATTHRTYITHPLMHADKHNCTPTFWSRVVTSCWLVEESRNPCILAFSGSSCNTHTYCADSYRVIVKHAHKLQSCFSLTAATHTCTVIMHTRRDHYRSPCYISPLRMCPVR